MAARDAPQPVAAPPSLEPQLVAVPLAPELPIAAPLAPELPVAAPLAPEAPQPVAAPLASEPPPPDSAADEAQLDLESPGWWLPPEPRVLAPPPADGPLDPCEAQIAAVLQRLLSGDELDLPVLSTIAQRALLKLRSNDVDYDDLAELVGEDPALAAGILRVVNSTAYARMFRIDRLRVALARLGCATVRGIILAASLKGVAIRTGGAQRTLGEELWQRAIVSAVLLSELSRRYGLSDGEAFLVGLLHDLGDLAIVRVLHGERSAGATVSRATFKRLSGEWHEALGAHLARVWRLNAPLPELIGDHHRAPAADDPLSLYRSLVQLSDAVCSLLGYGEHVPYDFFALPCVRGLGIGDTAETRNWLANLPALIYERTGVF